MKLWNCMGVFTPFDPTYALLTSPLFSPAVLALIRLTLASYTLITLLFTLIYGSVHLRTGQSFFSFFTNLSYIGQCAYFWAAGVQTLVYAKGGENSKVALQNWPRWLQFLHILLQSTVVTFPILVTIVFWALLSSPQTFDSTYSGWSAVSVHALNTPFALFEIFLTHCPPIPWLLLPFGLFFLACYLGIAYITNAAQGFYPYDFINPHTQHARLAAYIVGIAAAECIIFSLVHCAAVIRQRFVGARSSGGRGVEVPREELDEWEEVERPRSRTESGLGSGLGSTSMMSEKV